MNDRVVDLIVNIFAKGDLSTQTQATFVLHALDMCRRGRIAEAANCLYRMQRGDVLLAIGQHFLAQKRIGRAMKCLCFVDDKPTLLRLAEEARAQGHFGLAGGACALAGDRALFQRYHDDAYAANDTGALDALVSGAEVYAFAKRERAALPPSAPTPDIIGLVACVLRHEVTDGRPPT